MVLERIVNYVKRLYSLCPVHPKGVENMTIRELLEERLYFELDRRDMIEQKEKLERVLGYEF